MATKKATRATPLPVLAAAAADHAKVSGWEASRYRQLARATRKAKSTHPETRRREIDVFRRAALLHDQRSRLFDEIAAKLLSLIPATAALGKVPRGYIEFRVYLGRDHSAHWRALRGNRVIASAHGYDRKRDGTRSVRRLVAAIQAGKFVITTVGKGGR